MKNILQKLGGALIAIVVLVVPVFSYAAAFNTGAEDIPMFEVMNTTVSGINCTTCWATSVSANPGDAISFSIYYHNTSSDTATNVRVRLTPQSTGSGTNHYFTASVMADNAPTSNGTATVVLTPSHSLAFVPRGVLWRANGSVGGSTPLPFGQSGNELFSTNGLRLGNVGPGWSTQGSIIVYYRVASASQNTSTPSVTTSSASSVTASSAVLNGYVNPNNTTDTTRWFEWGTSQNLGNSTTHYNQGSGSSNFSETIYGLSQNDTYYYRAVAKNSQGVVYGNILNFYTIGGSNTNLPSVTTSSASSVTASSAVLNGYVNPNNTTDTTRWFEWGTSQNLGNSTTHYNQGSGSSNFSETIYGLSQNDTYYYRAVAKNSQETVYGDTYSFLTSGHYNYDYNYNTGCGSYGYSTYCGTNIPTINTRNADVSGSFAVLNGYVDPRDTNDTTRWFEWGGAQYLGNSTQKLSQGYAASTFSATLTELVPNTIYYYRAVARNSMGTVYGSTLSFTTPGYYSGSTYGYGGNASAPSATTLFATESVDGIAKLNGLVLTSAGQSSNAWFEWGENTNLGNKTATISVGALPVVKHSEFISGLASGRTYFYRIIAENPYGKAYGTIMSFVAGRETAVITSLPPPVKVATPKKVTTPSVQGNVPQPLMRLTLDGGGENIASGEARTYHVTWKNTSGKILTNVVARVTPASSMQFTVADKGSFSKTDNTLTINLGTLSVNDQGEAFISGVFGKGLTLGQVLVVTANIVYTDTAGGQGDEIAYVTHRVMDAVGGQNTTAFAAGAFLPTTLFEWLLLIILILLLILAGNHLYGRFAGGK